MKIICRASVFFGLVLCLAGTALAQGVDADLSAYPEMRHRKLTLPKTGTKPYPVMLDGGGEFLENGYAVMGGIQVGRGKSPSGGERCIRDAKSIVRWIRANGAKFDLDVNHIGVWCGSFDAYTKMGLASSGNIKSVTFGDKTWDLVGPNPANPGFDDRIQCVVGRPWGAVLEELRPWVDGRNPHLTTEEWMLWLGIPLLASSNSPPMISDGESHAGPITGVYLTKCFLDEVGVPFINTKCYQRHVDTALRDMLRVGFADVYLKEVKTTKVFAQTMFPVVRGGTYSWFTFARLQKDLSKPLEVRFAIGGSAVAGVDYEAIPTSITIPAGKAEYALKVKALTNKTAKGVKQITVKITPDSAYESPYPNAAVMDILETAEPEIVTIGTIPFAVGPTGQGMITVARVGSLDKEVSVNAEILTSGKADVDFEPIKVPIIIAAGAYETKVPVIPKRYPVAGEKVTSVVVLLKGGTGYNIDTTSGLGGSYSQAAGVVIVNADHDPQLNLKHYIPNPFGAE